MNTECTLSNDELIEKCNEWVSSLAKTGGKSWTLHVPVSFNSDPDMLFCELAKRFKAAIESPAPTPQETEAYVYLKYPEFKPQNTNLVPIRYWLGEVRCLCTGQYVDNEWIRSDKSKLPENVAIEWLSPVTIKTEQPDENDAVRFKDWCDNNVWEIETREERTFTATELYKGPYQEYLQSLKLNHKQ